MQFNLIQQLLYLTQCKRARPDARGGTVRACFQLLFEVLGRKTRTSEQHVHERLVNGLAYEKIQTEVHG